MLANRWSPVVGVVESVRDTSLEAAAVGEAYIPPSIADPSVPDSIAPFTPPVASFVLRTRGDPGALSASVRREIRAMDASVPVYDLEPLTGALSRAIRSR